MTRLPRHRNHDPYKKPPGRDLSDVRRAANTVLNQLRAAVERAIAHVKCWKVLKTGFRRSLLRSRRLDVTGHSNLTVSAAEQMAALSAPLGYLAGGRIEAPHEVWSAQDVAAA